MSYVCAGKTFKLLSEAMVFADELFKSKGIAAGIEIKKPKKLSKKAAKELVAARIQRAVVGFQIPMTSITKLYKQMEDAVAAGKSDEYLKIVVAEFPGVVASNI